MSAGSPPLTLTFAYLLSRGRMKISHSISSPALAGEAYLKGQAGREHASAPLRSAFERSAAACGLQLENVVAAMTSKIFAPSLSELGSLGINNFEIIPDAVSPQYLSPINLLGGGIESIFGLKARRVIVLDTASCKEPWRTDLMLTGT